MNQITIESLFWAFLVTLLMAFPASTGAAEIPKIVREVCIACHGADGNGGQPFTPEYPKLAGKQSEYLKKQLRDYQAGKRKNPVMSPMAANLAPEQIEEVSVYYSAQPNKPNKVANPALLEPGKKIYDDGNPESGVPACAGCHLPDASGSMRYPHLAGQNAQYSYGELKKFASGERDNDRGLVMQSVTLRMSDAEMKAVSEYIMGLK